MMYKVAVVGRFDHPLLAGVSVNGGFDGAFRINWGADGYGDITFALTGVRRFKNLVYLAFKLAQFDKVVFHFVRKDFLIFIVPLLLISGINVKFFFWGSDTRYQPRLYRLISRLGRNVKVYCSSKGVAARLQELGLDDIYIRHFPSPNIDVVLKALKIRKERNLDEDSSPRLAIVIGNNGRAEQKHFELLDKLADWNLSKNVTIVHFPLSYMCFVDCDELRRKAEYVFPSAKVHFYFEQLTDSQKLKCYSADFYFNLQERDALSTFLCEMISAGARCIVNTKPKYEEFRCVSSLMYFDDLDESLLELGLTMSESDLELFHLNYLYATDKYGLREAFC